MRERVCASVRERERVREGDRDRLIHAYTSITINASTIVLTDERK